MREVSLSSENSDEITYNAASLKERFYFFPNDCAHAWNISRGMMMFLWVLPLIFCFAGVVAALMGKSAYKAFTTEDGIAENIQVVFFIVAFVFCFRIVHNRAHRRDYLYAVLYGILCVGLFFIIGEEVSWGQRIIGWDTPQHLKIANKQDETNLHNIYGVGETIKWLHLVFAAYGTFMPILLMRSNRLERYSHHLAMIVPHYSLIPYFFISLVWRLFRNLVDVPKRFYFVVSEYTEVIELVIASAIMLFLIYQYRRLSRKDVSAQREKNASQKTFVQ